MVLLRTLNSFSLQLRRDRQHAASLRALHCIYNAEHRCDSQWMGSAPGHAVASQLLRPTGHPDDGLACGGVSDT